MKNKINIMNIGIFFLILTIIFLPAKNIQAAPIMGWSVSNISGYNLPSAPIYFIVFNIMDWLLGLVGAVGIIGFAIAGFLYLTAAGNETQMEKAKKSMLYSIIGVIVALAGLVVLNAAYYMLFATTF